MIRTIEAKLIRDEISKLCIKANTSLRCDCYDALKASLSKETNHRAKEALKQIIENADIAYFEKLAICQDTGMLIVFLEIGQDANIKGDLKKAVNNGVSDGYKKGCLRNSIIKDPLNRSSAGFGPAVIHQELTKGNKVKITVLPKGFGCENKSRLKMFNPTASLNDIKKFIIESVKLAGADACPPYVVGVGIGGTADYACLLAKKALLKRVNGPWSMVYGLEKELLNKINKLNIGPMGLGGKTTALAVNIVTFPTHIAGLPVAVNISCHALRSATTTI
jgi:fumarate hydratase subunit alpha